MGSNMYSKVSLEKFHMFKTHYSKSTGKVCEPGRVMVRRFGVEVQDFGKSWRSGLAFLALIKSINPALVDLRDSLSADSRENVQLAFTVAHRSLDVPPLLEPEGKTVSRLSVRTERNTMLHLLMCGNCVFPQMCCAQ